MRVCFYHNDGGLGRHDGQAERYRHALESVSKVGIGRIEMIAAGFGSRRF
jgi:hypothetical protein